MAKKPESPKRAQRRMEERAALNHIYTSFMVGLGAECYLFLLYQLFIRGSVGATLFWAQWILPILTWTGVAAVIGGVVLALLKKQDKKLRKIGLIAAPTGLFVAVSSVIALKFFDVGLLGLCAGVAVATILALIYFLYHRECFLNTTVLAVALFVLWICGRALDSSWKTVVVAGVAGIAVLLAAMCVLVARMSKHGGKLGELQIFSADCNYLMIYLVAAVAIVIMAAAVLAPSVIFYLIWAAVIVLFAELGYYTVKMM